MYEGPYITTSGSTRRNQAGYPRVSRTEWRGSGWRVIYTVQGQRKSWYFPDAEFGSAARAKAAAVACAEHNRQLLDELLGLHRRLTAKANTASGVVGVTRLPGHKSGPFWLAYFADPMSGRRRSRYFAVSRYGEEGARDLAIEWREEAMRPFRERYTEILRILSLPRRPEVPPEAAAA